MAGNIFDNTNVREVSVMTPERRKENCTLLEPKLGKDDKNMWVDFPFKDNKGNDLQHREFLPTRRNTDTDEDFAKTLSLSVSRIAHITRAFITEEEFKAIKIEGGDNLARATDNWKKYVQASLDALKGKLGVKCALKVVYRKPSKGSNKYYVSLPAVPPFISTENHPKEFTTDPQYDIYEIPSNNYTYDKEKGTQDAAEQAAQGFTDAPDVGAAPGGWN